MLELEGLDGERAKLEGERAEIPERRGALEREREARRERIEAVQGAIAHLEHEQREREAALADTETLLARLDGQQYEVTSKSAYEALRHEMDAARAAQSEHETAILERMELIEETRQELGRLETQARAADTALEEELRALHERDAELAAELGRVDALRRERAAEVDGEALQRYERIASHRRPAAVVVSGSACPECQIRIPPQNAMELRAGSVMLTCESCHRILVHESIAAA